MNGTGQYFDPAKINEKIREMLIKGDTSELPGLIQEVLMQSIANPLIHSILAPLAQSMAAPISQYFNSTFGSSAKSEPASQKEPVEVITNRLNPELFEIHGFVVIRTMIPEDVDEKNIKVFIAPTHATIKGDPSGNDHIIPLPYGAKKEGASAAFKDRILEIRIPKENYTETSEEVSVQYL